MYKCVFKMKRKTYASTENASPSISASTPNQSLYCNSCAHAKKSLKHTQYIYRYSHVYMYIYNIYINFYLNKKESSNPKPICVYQILDQPGL